jgi:hypothetical protein
MTSFYNNGTGKLAIFSLKGQSRLILVNSVRSIHFNREFLSDLLFMVFRFCNVWGPQMFIILFVIVSMKMLSNSANSNESRWCHHKSVS